jgi:hypothetical protein
MCDSTQDPCTIHFLGLVFLKPRPEDFHSPHFGNLVRTFTNATSILFWYQKRRALQ